MVNMQVARLDGLCFIETTLLSWYENYGIQEAAEQFSVSVAASVHSSGRVLCTFVTELLTYILLLS